MNGLVLVTIGVLSFLLLASHTAWLYVWYRHKAKCLWYREREKDVLEIRETLWDIQHRGYGMVEIHRVDPSNLYRVRP